MTKELIKLIKGYGKWMKERETNIINTFNEARESHYAWKLGKPLRDQTQETKDWLAGLLIND
jgi:hypothetical protein